MTYPTTWTASTDPAIESGTATFTIDGRVYTLRLESFDDHQTVTHMLDAVFKQGKRFALQCITGHVTEAITRAERQHDL